MSEPGPAADMSALPKYAFGSRMTTWWGSILLIVMESAALAYACGSYLYLALLNPDWPLSAPPPDLLWGNLMTVLMFASLVPATMAKKYAQREDKRKVQILLVVLCTMGTIACVIRGFEFGALNVRWDTNAYGSVVWFILVVHTTHIVADLIDTFFVTALFLTGHTSGKRFSAVEDDAVFVYFVLAAWLPVYGLIYWFPRVWSP
ncbi:MAG: putative cytochrome c oxidase subunit protein [Devosia sp.]|nr:putative cytochrome c oxidase subunit protein [Devosia sp.]